MSLIAGIAVLALAVFLGGFAALFRERGEKVIPAIRSFAIVAAVSIALLHLLPEAFADIGWKALVAAALGFLVPAGLERLSPGHEGHEHDAPTTTLAIGYAAVVVHQLGEGAAVASLAKSGALSASIVFAIAAHTVPLSMVVAIRVLEVEGGETNHRLKATVLALVGVALSTVIGASAGNLLGESRFESAKSWILALIAGLLLHAIWHDVAMAGARTLRSRIVDSIAGLMGLAIAAFGIVREEWVQNMPPVLLLLGITALAVAIVARSFLLRRADPGAKASKH